MQGVCEGGKNDENHHQYVPDQLRRRLMLKNEAPLLPGVILDGYLGEKVARRG